LAKTEDMWPQVQYDGNKIFKRISCVNRMMTFKVRQFLSG